MKATSPETYLVDKELMPRGSPPEIAAEWLRLFNGWQEHDRADLVSFIEFMGWQIKLEKLNAEKNGLSGLLFPQPDGGFTIIIDPFPYSLDEPSVLLWEMPEVRFILAHEIAHTTFYTPGSPPYRSGQGRSTLSLPNPAEELFCDRFAASLLIPPELAKEFSEPYALLLASELYGCSAAAIKLSAELAI